MTYLYKLKKVEILLPRAAHFVISEKSGEGWGHETLNTHGWDCFTKIISRFPAIDECEILKSVRNTNENHPMNFAEKHDFWTFLEWKIDKNMNKIHKKFPKLGNFLWN